MSEDKFIILQIQVFNLELAIWREGEDRSINFWFGKKGRGGV